MWALAESKWLCYFRDPTNQSDCFEADKKFIACSGGTFYANHIGYGEHVYLYDANTSIKKDIGL